MSKYYSDDPEYSQMSPEEKETRDKIQDILERYNRNLNYSYTCSDEYGVSENYFEDVAEDIDKFYELKHIDAYQKLANPEGWLKCSVCGVLPRKWCFNNGKYATCLCYRMYDIHPVRAESIMSVHTRCNGNMKEYDSDALRKAWNIFAETGVVQNKLEDGRW